MSQPSRDVLPGERLVSVLTGMVMLGVAWGMVCTAPGIPWNGARLAPSFALARGLPFYALRDSGAHLGWVYGPVFPLWYLPTGLTDNPTVGLMLAALWNILTLVLPFWLVARVAAPRSRPVVRTMTGLGAILLLTNPITRGAFLFIHVDAVSIACAIMACLALHGAAFRGWRPGLPLAALGVALAVAAKQVSVVLVPASLVWLCWEGRQRLLAQWIFWLAAMCGGLAVIFFAVFGAEEMLFNAWLVFSRMPWQGGWEIFGRNVIELFRAGWFWALAALLVSLAVRFRWRGQVAAEAGSLARLLVCLALCQAPMGFTAAMMVDAGLNSLHALTYLLLAGLVVVASMLGERPSPDVRRLRQALWGITGLGAVVTVVGVMGLRLLWTPYRGQEELLALARRHEGRIYLPWNPLTTIITERKIYPFDEALHFMWLAGLEPPREAIVGAVPAKPMIIYQEPSQGRFALRYFDRSPEKRGPVGAAP